MTDSHGPLPRSQALDRAVHESVSLGIIVIDAAGLIRSLNPAAERLFGWKAEDIIGMNVNVLMPEPHHSEHDGYLAGHVWTSTKNVMRVEREVDALRKDGSRFQVEVSVTEMLVGEQRLFVGVTRDISERRRTEAALRRSETTLRETQRLAHVGSWSIDLISGESWWSDEMYRIFGVDPDTVTSTVQEVFLASVHPDDKVRVAERLARQLAGERTQADTFRIVRPDGEVVHVRSSAEPVADAAGRPIRLQGATQDITERTLAERALTQREAELHRAQAVARMGSWSVDLVTARCSWSPEFYRILGVPETTDPSWESILEATHPDDRQLVANAWDKANEDGRSLELQHRIIVDGETRWLHTRLEVESGPGGRPVGMFATSQDVTEKRALGEQLRQSQKMQVVGQLTGGIAHDFNNIINVIAGFGQLVMDDLAPEDPHHADLEQMLEAASRAALLTRQLLAFSRHQVLESRALDIDEVVESFKPMLTQTLGENVELAILHGPASCIVHADQGQLEQVLLNLAVNARDAMPTGGTLTIEVTRAELHEPHVAAARLDLTPGPYVMLAVSDTGKGMDEATRARIFEPFFTTKAATKGTGLGLATTHGIVHQSGGSISVDSEPGKGTTFRILLPRVTEASQVHLPVAVPGADPRGSEVILVVEDDEAGLIYERRVLEDRGYGVRVAASGTEALDVWAELDGAVDLLVTDVVLPGMSGPELAERLTGLRADLRVLFISGYTGTATFDHERFGRGASLLAKPFSPGAFTAKVRETLDEDHLGGARTVGSVGPGRGATGWTSGDHIGRVLVADRGARGSSETGPASSV